MAPDTSRPLADLAAELHVRLHDERHNIDELDTWRDAGERGLYRVLEAALVAWLEVADEIATHTIPDPVH